MSKSDKSKKTRVLFIFPRFGIGGVAKVLAFVANSCFQDGMDVECLSMSREKETIDLEDGIRKRYLPYLIRGNKFSQILYKIVYIISIRALIRELKPDIICVFRVDLVRMISIATYGISLRIIGSERGDPSGYTVVQRRKYERALKRCSAVIFQTEYARDFYCKQIQSKSLVIPNPAILRRGVLKEYNGERKKVIISCGRLSSEKNFIGLIKAFAKVSNKLNQYNLRIYGSGPEERALRSLVRELALEERVFLMGDHPDLFLEEFDCCMFVLNSNTEGMPNALIEAMSIGIPCIATDCPVGGVRFLSDSGRRVLLIHPNDEEMLARKMVELALSPSLQAILTKNALEIREVLDPTTIAKTWSNLVKSICSEKNIQAIV